MKSNWARLGTIYCKTENTSGCKLRAWSKCSTIDSLRYLITDGITAVLSKLNIHLHTNFRWFEPAQSHVRCKELKKWTNRPKGIYQSTPEMYFWVWNITLQINHVFIYCIRTEFNFPCTKKMQCVCKMLYCLFIGHWYSLYETISNLSMIPIHKTGFQTNASTFVRLRISLEKNDLLSVQNINDMLLND